jgi:hypothetical protein
MCALLAQVIAPKPVAKPSLQWLLRAISNGLVRYSTRRRRGLVFRRVGTDPWNSNPSGTQLLPEKFRYAVRAMRNRFVVSWYCGDQRKEGGLQKPKLLPYPLRMLCRLGTRCRSHDQAAPGFGRRERVVNAVVYSLVQILRRWLFEMLLKVKAWYSTRAPQNDGRSSHHNVALLLSIGLEYSSDFQFPA